MAWKQSDLDAHARWLDEQAAAWGWTQAEAEEPVESLEQRLQFRDPELVEHYAERPSFGASL